MFEPLQRYFPPTPAGGIRPAPAPWVRRLRGAAWSLAVLGVPARAEVPAEQAVGLYAATDPKHPELSPIWGLVAVKSGILANIRFYGGYDSAGRDGLARHPRLPPRNNCPLDGLAAVVEYLFPSPDGRNLTPNELDKDPIGGIAREARADRAAAAGDGKAAKAAPGAEGKGGRPVLRGLGKLQALLQGAVAYREQIASAAPAAGVETKSQYVSRISGGDAEKAAPAGALDRASEAFRDKVFHILAQPGKADSKASGTETKASKFDQMRHQFAGAFQRAVLEDATGTFRRYPPHAPEVAVLAYAWEVADRAEELWAAFSPGVLVKPPEAHRPRFDGTYYTQHLPDFLHRLGGAAGASPEETALFLQGYRMFESDLPDLAKFRLTDYHGQTYPDCGETSLRNFFSIAFTTRGVLDPQRRLGFMRKFEGKAAAGTVETKATAPAAPLGRVAAIQAFYEAHPRVADQKSDEAHHDWSHVVSGLNAAGDPLPIDYNRKGAFDLKGSGIPNMLNLVAHLLPDPLLNRPWPGDPAEARLLAAQKLTRLCELASTDGRILGWEMAGKREVSGDLGRVTFTINDLPAFRWEFVPGHFDLTEIAADSRKAWPATCGEGVKDPWLRVWLRRFQGQKPNGERKGDDPAAACPHPYDLFGFDLAYADTLAGIFTILASREEAWMPSYGLLVERSLPFDFWSLHRLVYLLEAYPSPAKAKPWYPISSLKERPPGEKLRMVLRAMGDGLFGSPEVMTLMVDHGADIHGEVAEGVPALWFALDEGIPLAARWLVQEGAKIDGRGPDGWTPLMVALREANGREDNGQILLQEGYEEAVPELLAAGADVNAASPDGWTPLLVALQSRIDGANAGLLLRAGARCTVQGPKGVTPLFLAARSFGLDLVRALVQAGADPRAVTAAGETVLDAARANPDPEVYGFLRALLAAAPATERKVEAAGAGAGGAKAVE